MVVFAKLKPSEGMVVRITEPKVFLEAGRTRCVLPLYDSDDQEVGYVTWWDEGERRIVGTIQIPQILDVTVHRSGTTPRIELQIEVVKGVPQCRAMTIRSIDGGREVRSTDLRDVKIADWIEHAVSSVARDVIRLRKGLVGVGLTRDGRTRSRARTAINVARAPNKMTKPVLKRIADVYRANIDQSPTAAVGRSFGISYSTAGKYVMRARQAGYLPPTTSGKKQS